jgi:hypothetical protein
MKSKASFLILLSLVFMTLVDCSHENRDGNKHGPDSSATEILEKSSAGFPAAISRSEQAPSPSINIGLVTWVKLDSFTMHFAGSGMDYNLFHIAIKSTAGVWDTLDVALLTNPGLMSDSTLLLFTLSNQEAMGIYEYTPSNHLMKPTNKIDWSWELNCWGDPKISPNGRFIVLLKTYPPYNDDENEIIDTPIQSGIYLEVKELPSWRFIGQSKNYDLDLSPRLPDPNLYWTDRFVRWDYPVRDSLLLPAVP